MSEAKSYLTMETRWENDTLEIVEKVTNAYNKALETTVTRHFGCDLSELRAYLLWRRGQAPEPARRALWVRRKDPYAEYNQKKYYLRCSECNMSATLDWKGNEVLTPYCPYCGAKMDYREGDEEARNG